MSADTYLRELTAWLARRTATATPRPRWSPIDLDPATIAELGMRPKGVIKR